MNIHTNAKRNTITNKNVNANTIKNINANTIVDTNSQKYTNILSFLIREGVKKIITFLVVFYY